MITDTSKKLAVDVHIEIDVNANETMINMVKHKE